ncbi:MAG: GNAT family N-acetyltransferase [Gemmatimonadaceae bacterium]
MPLPPPVQADSALALLASAADAHPTNPFLTTAYARSRERLGERLYMFSTAENSGPEAWCPAFLQRRRYGAAIEFPSLTVLGDSAAFVDSVTQFCNTTGTIEIGLHTFGLAHSVVAPDLAAFGGETARHHRREFLIKLASDDILAKLSRSHRQRVRQAQRAGLLLERRRDVAACTEHALLMSQSMARRRARGEDAPGDAQTTPLLAMLETGAGELFRAVRDGQVLSSMLVLRAERGGYDQSSGSSPEGMTAGAAQFLIYETAEALRAEGSAVLNLGGVRPDETGLRDFKSHFGGTEIESEATDTLRPTTLLKVSGAVRSLLAGARRVSTPPL